MSASAYKMKMSIVLDMIHLVVSEPLDRLFMSANIILGMLDGGFPMFTSPLPPQIQALLGYVHYHHSRNHFLAAHFRIPRSLHPVEMVY
jgi:hypothetical protein